MKVQVICFWVLIPQRPCVGVSGRSRGRKTSVTVMRVSVNFDQMHWDRLCVGGCPTQEYSLCMTKQQQQLKKRRHMHLCMNLQIWLIVCMCFSGEGMWVWKAVPEGSRQSKGVIFSSMARIHSSLSSISQLTWTWGEQGICCCYSSFCPSVFYFYSLLVSQQRKKVI